MPPALHPSAQLSHPLQLCKASLPICAMVWFCRVVLYLCHLTSYIFSLRSRNVRSVVVEIMRQVFRHIKRTDFFPTSIFYLNVDMTFILSIIVYISAAFLPVQYSTGLPPFSSAAPHTHTFTSVHHTLPSLYCAPLCSRRSVQAQELVLWLLAHHPHAAWSGFQCLLLRSYFWHLL